MRRVWFATACVACASTLTGAIGPARAQSPAPESPVPAFTTLDGAARTPAFIDARVARLMRDARVPGLALAVIRNGQVVYVRAYGDRDVGTHAELTPSTVMYAASLTKATFAYFVMQLVDTHRVDLDRSIAAYLPKPLPAYPEYADLAGDERWRALTLRILLDHTSGLQNFRWIDDDKKLRFHRDPGARFGYSGEGLNLAQFVLERGVGISVASEMQQRIFDRFGMERTGMTWRDRFAGNVAQSYDASGALVAHVHHRHAQVAGSMDTTILDWSTFLAAVVRGDGLSARAKAEMIRRQIAIDSVTQFPTMRDTRTTQYASIGLGYGIGWGTFETPYGHAFFKEGHDDGTANYAMCVDARAACVLVMSNSVRAERIITTLVDELLGPVKLPWRWEGYGPPVASARSVRRDASGAVSAVATSASPANTRYATR